MISLIRFSFFALFFENYYEGQKKTYFLKNIIVIKTKLLYLFSKSSLIKCNFLCYFMPKFLMLYSRSSEVWMNLSIILILCVLNKNQFGKYLKRLNNKKMLIILYVGLVFNLFYSGWYKNINLFLKYTLTIILLLLRCINLNCNKLYAILLHVWIWNNIIIVESTVTLLWMLNKILILWIFLIL